MINFKNFFFVAHPFGQSVGLVDKWISLVGWFVDWLVVWLVRRKSNQYRGPIVDDSFVRVCGLVLNKAGYTAVRWVPRVICSLTPSLLPPPLSPPSLPPSSLPITSSRHPEPLAVSTIEKMRFSALKKALPDGRTDRPSYRGAL